MPMVGTASALATRLILAAWCLLSVGVSVHEGEYSAPGLACVVLGLLLLAAVVAGGLVPRRPDRAELGIAVAVAFASAAVHPVDRLMHTGGGDLLAIQIAAAVTVAAAAATLLVRRRDGIAWAVGAGLALVTGCLVIAFVTNPKIDVWYLLQQSSTGLLHGDDMYRQHWAHSHGLRAVYPYLPMSTVLLAPFRWITGDVRAGLLLASVATSALLRRLAPAAPVALALLVLVHPHWAFLIDQSWTEPLLLFLLVTAVVATERGRPIVAVIALAAAVAAKQHVVLLLPLFALWPAFGWRRTLAAAGLAAVAVLPWVAAGPADFWHDAVHANVVLGVIPRALCVPSFLQRHGITVGFWFPLLGLLAAYAGCLRAPRTAVGLALGSALVLWTVDATNKQSFFNHYTLPLGLLVLALTAASQREEVAT
ncbi:MAG: hypothetical protein QOC82_550 [Frankiaceae bacterium]|jgi:hypothetical protein|nr:hypothetical protein [Frankiaceae bacterium]